MQAANETIAELRVKTEDLKYQVRAEIERNARIERGLQEIEAVRETCQAAVADKEALAQILGLLGQSRIANNLNQLAYHANTGSLPVDDVTKGQIEEAYGHVLFLRKSLIRALGQRE